jgi:3-deoxy-D-manno-octulosonic-acid transferase
MRFLYSMMWWLVMPLVLARLWLRGRKESGYRQHWLERLGCYGAKLAPGKTLWVHAVSVGETRAVEPLITGLLADWPDCRIVLTHMTPTGRAAGQALYGVHGARLIQSYLPYDTAFMVGRFIDHFSPTACILMETEVWPNLIAVCGQRQVPVVLVNARLSQRSLDKAQRLGNLMQDAARGIALVAAQTEADAARVRSLGVANVVVTGSIKFDVTPPSEALVAGAQLRSLFDQRRVLLCASTREGEEALILDAYLRAQVPPDVLLVIVPRHPQRFDSVAGLIEARSLKWLRRSQLHEGAVAPDVQLVLGDSMGEMFAYYAACDCAFIGGSLLPLGGQNLIEACALGKPVLVGLHTFNFDLVTHDAITISAALRVDDAEHLMRESVRLLADDGLRSVMGVQAARFARQHRGATLRTLALLQPLIADRR